MSNKLQKTIGKNLKKAREKKHLTQAEVAEKSGVSVNHYAKLERGETTPGIDTLASVIKAIGVKSSDILPF